MVSLIASIDASALTFTVDDATARYEGQVTVLARVKTKTGETLFTRSEHYNLTGETARLEKAKTGQILFFTAPEVAAGSHTIEWVVRDDEGARASVARSAIDVPGADEHGRRRCDSRRTHRGRAERQSRRDQSARLEGAAALPAPGRARQPCRERDLSFALPMVVPRGGARPLPCCACSLRKSPRRNAARPGHSSEGWTARRAWSPVHRGSAAGSLRPPDCGLGRPGTGDPLGRIHGDRLSSATGAVGPDVI